jgi:glycosyltransferase involved in cell wall biosynthesis
MLSILIPVYNFPCVGLVRELAVQAMTAGIPFEIICMDDASTDYRDKNQAIREVPHSVYIELPENVGRSRIRNLLVAKAQYDTLLFLDCDSEIIDGNYLQTYLNACRQYDIVAGGTCYEAHPPLDRRYVLHWTVGAQREPRPDDNQQKMFTSNNFMIRKAIIEKYPFNEAIVRYGHEDSFFQMELEKQGLHIRFIHNPVLHSGLETNGRFIEKTQESVRNLYDLYASGLFRDRNAGRIRLLQTYLCLKQKKADRIFDCFFPLIDRLNRKTNAGGYPCLWVFDLYKLAFLVRIAREKAKNREKVA